MPAQLHKHFKEASTDDLLVILKFFDHPNLRRYYTGLLADIRKELDDRGIMARWKMTKAGALECCKCGRIETQRCPRCRQPQCPCTDLTHCTLCQTPIVWPQNR